MTLPSASVPTCTPQIIMTPPSIPEEYYMCSEAECRERQSSGEISIFESIRPPPPPSSSSSTTTKNSAAPPRKQQPRRVVNPRFAMTKYRRSAAGVDTKNRTPPRSLESLDCCVSILEYILCHQQQPPHQHPPPGKNKALTIFRNNP
jgi:hypothetical protein